MVFNLPKIMELSYLVLGVLIITGAIAQQQQQQQQQNQQLRAEFRNNQEPQFQPPLPGLPGPFSNNQPQQQQVNFQQRQLQPQPQQPQTFQQNPQGFQQPQQQNVQQNPAQQNFQQRPQQPQQDVFNFNRPQQEALPTLPPVFIPPNNPIGPPPQLQSPIRNLFRQPESTFSFSNILSRFLNLFNLNSN